MIAHLSAKHIKVVRRDRLSPPCQFNRNRGRDGRPRRRFRSGQVPRPGRRPRSGPENRKIGSNGDHPAARQLFPTAEKKGRLLARINSRLRQQAHRRPAKRENWTSSSGEGLSPSTPRTRSSIPRRTDQFPARWKLKKISPARAAKSFLLTF